MNPCCIRGFGGCEWINNPLLIKEKKNTGKGPGLYLLNKYYQIVSFNYTSMASILRMNNIPFIRWDWLRQCCYIWKTMDLIISINFRYTFLSNTQYQHHLFSTSFINGISTKFKIKLVCVTWKLFWFQNITYN